MNNKKNIKESMREALKRLDLSSASIDKIQEEIKDNSELIGAFEQKKSDIEKILKHRDVSKGLSYRKLNAYALGHNKDAWQKLSKDITVKNKQGTTMKVNFSSTPAADLGIFTHLEKGEGLTSGEENQEHAGNLWKTEAKSDDKVLFSALRHRNTRGNENASKEIILAAAIEQYGLNKLQKSQEDKVWEVKLGNVQLMSPIGKNSPLSPDKDMPFKQMKAFEKLENEPFDMKIKDESGNTKTIKLRLAKTIMVNFGTNIQHYALKGKLVTSSYKENRKALLNLFGEKILKSIEEKFKTCSSKNRKNKDIKENILNREFEENIKEGSLKLQETGEVGKYLNSLYEAKRSKSISEKDTKEIDLKIKKIINLSKQILELWSCTNGIGIKSNPAAIPTRVSALLYLIGYPVSFNCKSGKDRTGDVSAEINDLVTTMEAKEGEVPDPYAKLTDEEKLQMSNIFDATQSDVITEANTGFKGLKVDLKETTRRIGKVRGTSKHAKPSKEYKKVEAKNDN